MSDRWIVIPNWEKFQHYADRNPVWIKLYTEIGSDDDWLALSMHERGVLVTVWIEYARSRGVLSVRRVCGPDNRYGNVKRALNSLQRAGFIAIVASKPLALTRSREVEKSKKKKEPAAQKPQKQNQTAEPPEPEPIDYKTWLAELEGKVKA